MLTGGDERDTEKRSALLSSGRHDAASVAEISCGLAQRERGAGPPSKQGAGCIARLKTISVPCFCQMQEIWGSSATRRLGRLDRDPQPPEGAPTPEPPKAGEQIAEMPF